MRKKIAIIVTVLSVLSAATPPASGRQAAEGERQDDQTRLEALEVMVDAVVLDDKKRPVTGLTASDFVVVEDGKEQAITDFRAVVGDLATAGAEERPEVPWTHNTIVVTDGTVQEIHMADVRKALAKYVDEIQTRNDYLALFTFASGGLRVLQPSTSDKTELREAIAGARGGLGSAREAERASVEAGRQGLPYDAYSTQVIVGGEEGAPQPMGTATGGLAGASPSLPPDLREIGLRLARTAISRAEELRSIGTAYTIFDSLMALIDSHRVLPGRRSITIFSEGFLQTRQAEPLKEAVLNAAAAAGVTLYIVDARGLSTDAERGAASINDVNRTQNQAGMRGDDFKSERTSSLGGGTIFDTSVRDQATRTDVLSQFATRTGGLFMKNSNDLFSGLRQITTDLRNYYLIYYQPATPPVAGEYRKITVRVRNRANVTVRAREGYFAIPDDARALFRLEDQRLYIKASAAGSSAELPFSLRPYAFGTPGGGTRVSYVLRIPPEAISAKGSEGKKLAASFYVLLIARGPDGRVLGTQRLPIALELEAAEADQVRREGLRYEGGIDLGREEVARIEAVVSNEGTGAVAKAQLQVTAPDWTSGPALSDLVIGKAVVAPGAASERSFVHGDKYLLPLAQPVFGREEVLNILAAVYWPEGKAVEPPVLSIWRGKEMLASLQVTQLATGEGANGWLFTAIPVKEIPPGEYLLRLMVRDTQGRSARREAKFTVSN